MQHHPTVLVVQPDPLDGPGRFGRWFEDAGLHLRLVRPYDGEPVPPRLEEDALLVLGGRMSANDDADHPWLEGIRALQRQTVDIDRPALGICLGGQLMAQAFGGSVRRGDRGTESGVVDVVQRPEATTDDLFAGLPTPLSTGTWHDDMVDRLPGDAVWLASTPMYRHQAFRVGRSAWGVPFHPEIAPETFESWLVAAYAIDGRLDSAWADLVADFARRDSEVTAGNELLARRFASLVADRHTR